VVEDFETLSEKLARVTDECERLREENWRLRELLNQQTPRSMKSLVVAEQVHSESTQAPSRTESDTPELSVAGKIALFRSLFRGRDDVYAVRWESENGKSGYSPASIKDWDALRLVPKSEWKKRDKETRQLLPVTDAAMHNHLSGKITIGVYPLLPDETCWFLAVDFDQHSWKEDAAAFIHSCREWNVPAALERSRSGDGAHV
jgi:hypothetical protein